MIINIPLKRMLDDSYDISIGENLFDELIDDLQNNSKTAKLRYAIITDSNVKPLYAEPLASSLNAPIFSFDAGEINKTRETKSRIEDEMLSQGFGRDSCIIAVGGGVVTDMAGFIAGTFGRGIPYVNYATTFLAAADAAVGGKCAVDTPSGKNLIGMFHQPQKVYIDVTTWHTLPEKEMRCGFAETVKHAILADYEFFEFLETNVEGIIKLSCAPQVLEHIAKRNCEIKSNIVQQDEREHGIRAVLNLGHTIGHAIETLTNHEISHGEAVAIGLAKEAIIAQCKNYCTKEEVDRVIALLKKSGLPTEYSNELTPESIIEKMHTDKKVRSGIIHFILQKGIGDVDPNTIAFSDDELRSLPIW
jgi:3-dehydroquinate synthase